MFDLKVNHFDNILHYLYIEYITKFSFKKTVFLLTVKYR